MVKDMNPLNWTAYILTIVGGLNWALVGMGNFAGGNWDLVNLLLGSIPVLRDIVYIVVGLSAAYVLYILLAKR